MMIRPNTPKPKEQTFYPSFFCLECQLRHTFETEVKYLNPALIFLSFLQLPKKIAIETATNMGWYKRRLYQQSYLVILL
mgnify:CR=1 FL=1